MNHSSHVGFSGPPASATSDGCFRALSLGQLPRIASEARRVGIFLSAVASPSPLVLLAPLRLQFPHTVRVGSNNPQPLSLMGSAAGVRAQHSPRRIKPQRGQVTEDDLQPSANKSWGVLHEDVSRLHLANDPRHLSPEPAALAVDTCAFARDGYVLAGKPARNHVNNASPGSPIKGADVIPYGEGREAAVVLARAEDGLRVGVALDGADAAPAEQVSTKDAAASACEQGELP